MVSILIVSINLFLLFVYGGLVQSSEDDILQEARISQGKLNGRMRLAGKNRFGPTRFLGVRYYEFQGIPYAEPPVGPLRFKPPQPPKSWTGTRLVTTPGPDCFQPHNPVTGSEDCLYINIYTPEMPSEYIALKPVMVYIHGGGFRVGNGFSDLGPEYIVSKDVLLVTFNYRLGVLGFLSLEDETLSGNYGLKDQVQALKWVQENIANFGGDPKNVTIFGQSAGGVSVHYHMISPLSKGLFSQAIIQSGTALSPWAFNPNPKATAISLAQIMGFNVNDVTELHDFFMNAKASNLTQAGQLLYQQKLHNIRNLNMALFVPCVESSGGNDAFITQPPAEIIHSDYAGVPLIIGTLDADGSIIFTGKHFSENDFKILNEFSDWAVPLNWKISPGQEKNQLGQKIKEHYFGGDKISFSSANSMVKFFTDTYFVMDTQQSIRAHLENSKAPIYNYEFSLPTSKSDKFLANLFQQKPLELNGAAHSDELPLLFNIDLYQNYSTKPEIKGDPSLLDKEEEISDIMVFMWTHFAKTGNPNYKGIQVTWDPLEEDSFSYLEIGSTLKMNTGKVQQESLHFWQELCRSTTTSYRCDNL